METEIQQSQQQEYQKRFDDFVAKYNRQPSLRWIRKTAKQVKLKFPEPIIMPPGFVDDDETYGLPITIALNHKALGVTKDTICEACKRDEHWNCNLATWCHCDDPADGDDSAICYDPLEDLP